MTGTGFSRMSGTRPGARMSVPISRKRLGGACAGGRQAVITDFRDIQMRWTAAQCHNEPDLAAPGAALPMTPALTSEFNLPVPVLVVEDEPLIRELRMADPGLGILVIPPEAPRTRARPARQPGWFAGALDRVGGRLELQSRPGHAVPTVCLTPPKPAST